MLAQTNQSPHASGCPVKGGISPCRSSQRAKLPKRHFSFWELFLFVPFMAKRKSGLTVWVSLFLWAYSGFVRRKPTPRFLLTQKAQKKAHKENADALRRKRSLFSQMDLQASRSSAKKLPDELVRTHRQTIIYRSPLTLKTTKNKGDITAPFCQLS